VKQEKPVLMVIFLSQAWSSAVDSAQYHATFIEMPEGNDNLSSPLSSWPGLTRPSSRHAVHRFKTDTG
jgi:hypothetical protein